MWQQNENELLTQINEEYKIWKKCVPFYYDTLLTYETDSAS